MMYYPYEMHATVLDKDKTKSRIRGMMNEAKMNATFDILSDQTLEDIVKISLALRSANASVRNLDEKKTLASLMPAEAREVLKERFGIDINTDAARITIGEQIFDRLIKYLARNPARLTLGIYDAFVEHKNFHYVVSLVQKKTDEKGNVYLIPTNTAMTQNNAIDAEFIINLQNMVMAKARMIVESITKADVKQANLALKSKALRDMLAAMHMMRLDFSPDQAMETTYSETKTEDDGKTVKEKVVRYVQRSSQTWNQKDK